MMKKMLKLTILLSGTAYVISTAIFVVLLASLARVYSNASASSIGLVLALPAGLMVPAVYISGKLCSVMSKKTILIIGYVIFTVSGIAGIFAENITILLVMRAFTGIGIGIIMPIPRALIAQFYVEAERASMIGLLSAINGFLSMILSVIVGILIEKNWYLPYYVFLLGAVIIALVIVFIPKVSAEKMDKTDGAKKSPSLGKDVFILTGCAFILFILISILQMKLAVFIESGQFGNASIIGITSAVFTGGAMVAGFLFGKIFTAFNRYTSVIGSGVGTIGYYIFVYAQSTTCLLIGCFIIGFASVGLLTPFIITRVSMVVPALRKTMAVTWITTASYLGQFIGVYVIQIIEKIFNNSNPKTSLTFVLYSYVLITLITLTYVKLTKQRDVTI